MQAHAHAKPRAELLVIWFWVVVGLGCQSAPTSIAETPPTKPGRAAYPGQCQFLGLEMVEAPTDRSQSVGESASVQLVASYRPGESESPPLGLSFRVRRERVDDLRLHLEQHPTVLCTPKPESGGGEVQVPPFEGQAGEPVAPKTP